MLGAGFEYCIMIFNTDYHFANRKPRGSVKRSLQKRKEASQYSGFDAGKRKTFTGSPPTPHSPRWCLYISHVK